ncbi:MAG: J domain-containing protein [Alphaproteobacteria bacterium]|nr:J domain-containing protein [Alphaproteobacteria bacterium]
MIKKCDHPGCTKAGTCRAPKTRELKDYWWFCQEHAAEYNKNWNYYANMTPEEINTEWERETFGYAEKDIEQANQKEIDYVKFLNDFLSGRGAFDKMPKKKSTPSEIVSAFKELDLPITSTWTEIAKKYRELAKIHHPDTSKNKDKSAKEFTRISTAYEKLKKHFKK